MSQNNSKIPTIIALILLALILIGVFFVVSQPKAATSTKATTSQSSVKTAASQLASNPKEKCQFTNQKTTTIKQVDTEKLKLITIEDTKPGTGEEVKSGDVVCIDYKGSLTDGSIFDESYKRGQPFVTQIGVGQVIQGWDYGIVGLKEGGKRKLTIPADLAYGSRATGSIPANSTLVFEVELVKIIR